MRKLSHAAPVLAVVLALAWTACEETTGPGFGPVPEEPGEVTVVDFEDSQVRDPSAFDAVGGVRARPDQTPEWDFVFAVRGDGTAELRPRGAVVEESSAAGLQSVDRSFDAVDRAPEGGYSTGSPVAVEEGDVLAGRSRQDPNFPGIRCHHFFKLEVLSVDTGAGTIDLRHLINPACERRNLVPGSSNQD